MFILYPFFNNDWTLTAILLFKEKEKISNYNMLRAYYQNNQSVHKNRSIGKRLSHRPFTAVSGVRFSMLRVIAVYSLRRYSRWKPLRHNRKWLWSPVMELVTFKRNFVAWKSTRSNMGRYASGSKRAVCKTVAILLRWFESNPTHELDSLNQLAENEIDIVLREKAPVQDLY